MKNKRKSIMRKGRGISTMNDNLKELEEFVNQNKDSGYFGLSSEMIQLIEKLIARNKKLEKSIDDDIENIINLAILCENAEKPIDKNIYADEVHAFLNALDYYYVPKSKVREKIEEYEELVKDFEEYWSKDPRKFKRQKSIDYYKLEALKELLQEGDK